MDHTAAVAGFALARLVWARLPRGLRLHHRAKTALRPALAPFDAVLEAIPYGSTVFDVGCGDGSLLLLAAVLRGASGLYGVEIRDRLVARARALLKSAGRDDADVWRYDGRTLDARVACASCVCLVDVLHHVAPPARAPLLREIQQRMVPGARFVLKDIDGAHVLRFGNRLHDLVFSREVVHEDPLAEQVVMVQRAGFRVLSTGFRRILYTPHCWVVAEKPFVADQPA